MRLLVTGATQGIGRELVSLALKDGHHVVAHGRNPMSLAELTAAGAVAVSGDLRDEPTMRQLTDVCREQQVDAVVASQGVAGDGALATLTAQRIRAIMEVNAASVIRLFDCLADDLAERRGTFVVIASQAALRPEMYDSAYCASKWAVLHWAIAMAQSQARHGIRVRALCPGRTATALYDDAMAGFAAAAGESLAGYTERILDAIPLRRVATVGETAGAALFLAAHEPRPVVLAETGGEVPYATVL